MIYLGIDPGKVCGFAVYDSDENRVIDSDNLSPESMMNCLDTERHYSNISIEMIGHYGTGMSVGKDVFHTCLLIGRMIQIAPQAKLILRPTVKGIICGSGRAKDGNVTQALKDQVGQRGTKKEPGATYGVKNHAWAALAVAVAASRGAATVDFGWEE
jgi:Holliday junction resolvasome RuvABC endonuclease subunit